MHARVLLPLVCLLRLSTSPAYGPNASLPADIEHQTLRAAAKWHLDSHLLIHPDEEAREFMCHAAHPAGQA